MTKPTVDAVLEQIRKSISEFEAMNEAHGIEDNTCIVISVIEAALPGLYKAEIQRIAQLTGKPQLVVAAQHFGHDIACCRMDQGSYPTVDQFAAYLNDLADLGYYKMIKTHKVIGTPVEELLNLL